MKSIIFDIDGTLANIDHRLHYIKNKPKNYDAFFDAMVDDELIIPIAKLLKSIRHEYPILLCSGRPDSHRETTTDWLRERAGFFPVFAYDKLYMRKTGDYRPDHIIKKEMLQQMRADGYDPFLAVEDRTATVKMYREEGLIALQCAGWDEGE